MICILTAAIGSGKTTALMQWAAKKKDVSGILTPVVGGKRFFMDLQTGQQFPMEAEDGEETLLIGRFVFSKAGFEKAIGIIRNAIHKKGWLVIDEIGPLELRGEGFAAVVKEVLAQRQDNIILVVREGLAEQVKEYFQLHNAKTITTSSLPIH